MILIGLTGKARSGKDTVADYLKKHYRFQTTAFAAPLKAGCKAMFGLSDAQVHGDLKEVVIPAYGCSPRQLMQWAGTEFGRNIVHPRIWLMQVENTWHSMLDAAHETLHSGLVVTDARFENETDMIRENGGVVIHVTRPGVTQVAAHSSESGVKVGPDDIVITNDGSLGMLYAQIDDVLASKLNLLKT